MITTSETSPLFDTISCQLPGGIEPYVPVAAEIDVPFDGRLVDLAKKIREHTQRLDHAMRTAVERMRSTGEMLLEAKRLCGKHGRWLQYLEYCGIPARYAQQCMRITRHWAEIEANTNSCSHLTVITARRLAQTQPQKALEHTAKTQATKAVGQAKAKKKESAALTIRSEPRRDHQAHVEIEQPPVPEPAPLDPADEQQDPQGASADSVQKTDDDASWLNSLPIRAELENPARFDEEAKLWKMARPHIDALRDILSPNRFELGRAATLSLAKTQYRLRVLFATHVRPPEEWKRSDRCAGKLTDRYAKIACPGCGGHGFIVTHEGDYQEAEI
jgi:hypothetical protein